MVLDGTLYKRIVHSPGQGEMVPTDENTLSIIYHIRCNGTPVCMFGYMTISFAFASFHRKI